MHARAHVISYAALAVAVTGTSYAAFEPIGADGDLDLCVKKKTGAVSIQKGSRCKRGTVPVAVNAEGLVGAPGQSGEQGPAGADGQPGARGATGPAGQRGATGLQGDRGATGAQGSRGATGPQGPAGTPAPTPPEPPPDPYGGAGSGLNYRVTIDGGSQIPLTSFAGCRDEALGVEYQDCYFETSSVRHTEAIFAWLEQTLAGPTQTHDLTVTEYSGATATRHIDVGGGFLSAFRIEDFNGSDSGTGHFEFVVVPAELQFAPGGTPPTSVTGQTTWRHSDFEFDIPGISRSGITAIRQLEVTIPKLLAPAHGSTRRHFLPGLPELSTLRLEIGSSGTTGTNLDTWVNNVGNGVSDARDGTITVFDQSLAATRFMVDLENLVPTSDLEPFTNASNGRREIRLDYADLEIIR